jgi:hypothetical protein
VSPHRRRSDKGLDIPPPPPKPPAKPPVPSSPVVTATAESADSGHHKPLSGR